MDICTFIIFIIWFFFAAQNPVRTDLQPSRVAVLDNILWYM